jgi:nucleotide-binding universal stress UspA family protein
MTAPVLARPPAPPATPSPSIVAGFDGSRGAVRAAATAERLAWRLGARLALANVAPLRIGASGAVSPRESRILAEHEGQHLFAELDGVAAGARRQIELGDPVVELCRLAAEEDALALVVGRRGRSSASAALLGTVSGRLIADATVPVIVGPEANGPPRLGGGGIVCGVDGSAHARRAVLAAAPLAERLDARLTLVAADDPVGGGPCAEVLADAARTAAGVADVEIALVPTVGDAAHQIARVAAERAADLVAVGPRGRGPWRAAVLGSVTTALMRLAACPVLVVPPGVDPSG